MTDAGWIEDLEQTAAGLLPAPVHHYIRTGAGLGLSAAEAGAAWQRLRFAPRVLNDVTEVDLGSTLLGTEVSAPVAVAPTTLQGQVHPDGECAMGRAVAAARSLMVVSSNAGRHFAQIADTGAAWWLQAYLPAQRSLAEPMLARAVDAGARAVVLTVDTPVVGTKPGNGPTVWESVDPSQLRVNFDPGHDELPGAHKATDLGPRDIGWLTEVTGLPVVVKGVLRPEDASRCVEAGASAVWVSNHGGRQLDRAVATADVLESVVSAVDGRAEVYVDGGIRSGTDVLAALALGAHAAFLGRSPVWALAQGEQRVGDLLSVLGDQLTEALRLIGARTPYDAVGTLVRTPRFGP